MNTFSFRCEVDHKEEDPYQFCIAKVVDHILGENLTKKIWSKRIFSDDFDADFEKLKDTQQKRFKMGSVLNSAIQEDAEVSEHDFTYLSDYSSSS